MLGECVIHIAACIITQRHQHMRHGGIHFERHTAIRRHMTGFGDAQEALLPQGYSVVALGKLGEDAHKAVELALIELIKRGILIERAYAQINSWRFLGQSCDERGQQHELGGIGHGYADDAFRRIWLEGPGASDDIPNRRQRMIDRSFELRCSFSWTHAPCRTHEKLILEEMPEAIETFARRRLGDPDPQRCPRDAAFCGDSLEEHKQVEIELGQIRVFILLSYEHYSNNALEEYLGQGHGPAIKQEAIMFGLSKSSRSVAEAFITQGISKADMAVFDKLVADDVVVETGLSPHGPIMGREAYKAVFAGFADAWPVSDFKVHDVLEAGDTIVIEFTATCVFRKDYYGVKATHQIVPLREIHRLKIKNGKVVHNTVGAINFPFEYIMYPALKDMIIGNLKVAS